jgi:hypothetical protein
MDNDSRAILSNSRDYRAGPRVVDDDLYEIRWPTFSQVAAAEHDAAQLLAWNRMLPMANTDDQREILAAIVNYLTPAIRSGGTGHLKTLLAR